MIDRRNAASRRQNDDRRDSQRLESFGSIRFLKSGSNSPVTLQGELREASTTGVRLHLEEELNDGDRVLIEVRDALGRCCNMTATVVWCRPESFETWAVGCELVVPLSNRQYQLLQSFTAVATN